MHRSFKSTNASSSQKYYRAALSLHRSNVAFGTDIGIKENKMLSSLRFTTPTSCQSLSRTSLRNSCCSTKSLRFLTTNSKKDSSSLITSIASDFWVGLRWKAVNALTSSLSKDEQRELLRRMDLEKELTNDDIKKSNLGKTATATTKRDDDNDVVVKFSIAEAVAAARAEEAQRLQSKWEKEKDEIIKQAELAAEERIKSEMIIQQRQVAFEKWQQDLQEEKMKLNDESTKISSENTYDSVDVVENSQKSHFDIHPLLGPVVLDLGHKRLHVVSAATLESIPIWEKQRIYRNERAKTMAADKMKSLDIGLPGVIGIHEDKNGKLSILDGQHRIGMMKILREKFVLLKDGPTIDLDRILVEVYPQQIFHSDISEKKHATDIFLEINKAEPVKLVDMPGVAKKADRNIITEAARRLNEKFIDMFSASQRCRPPHLNIDNLRDALFASNVLERHKLTSAAQLENWLLEQNKKLESKYCSKETPESSSSSDETSKSNTSTSISKSALEKAKKYKFFLGLESSWLYE